MLLVERRGRFCKCPKPRCQTMRQHFARRAGVSDKVLIAFMKKVDADKLWSQQDRPTQLIFIDRMPELAGPHFFPPRASVHEGHADA